MKIGQEVQVTEGEGDGREKMKWTGYGK